MRRIAPPQKRKQHLQAAFFGALLSLCSPVISADETISAPGPLDQPQDGRPNPGGNTPNGNPPAGPSSNPGLQQKELIEAVRAEQAALEKKPREDLIRGAKAGERASQIALGVDYAKEAQLLTFAPIAANDAASDAIRWYSIAAQRGFPGAPSLDLAGVRFYPVRVQRSAP